MGCTKVVREETHNPHADDDDDDQLSLMPARYTSWRIHATTGKQVEPGCYHGNLNTCLYRDGDSPFRFWDWAEAEISTPVFATTATSLSMKEIHVLTVNSLCRVLTRDMRLNTSAFNAEADSCGLSVFIGLGGMPIPETTLRRFLVIMWLLEDALFRFAPPWRVNTEECAPLGRDALVAHVNPLSLPQDCPDGLRDLIGPRLQGVIHPDKLQRAYYMWFVHINVLPRIIQTSETGTGCVSIPGCAGHKVPNAIEIKHAGSSLRPGEIISWTNMCLRIFQLCHFYEQQDVHRWRLKALLELVVDAMWHDELGGDGEAGLVLLKQLKMGGDIPIWQEAEAHWNTERFKDQLDFDPFVPYNGR